MSENEIDMNIDNYSIEDLYDILELNIEATGNEIKNKTDIIIQKFITKNKINEVDFFLNIRNKLLERIGEETDSSKYNRDIQREYWFQNEYSGNEPGVRDVKDSVNVYDSDTHPILNRKYLKPRGPVSQDQMNPTYQNTFSRIVTIDSQYRPNVIPHNDDPNSTTSSTNYTIDLTDKLSNVTKIELYSVNIPDSWYAFDSYLGNTCFWVEEICDDICSNNNAIHRVNIPSGNYDKKSLCDTINNAMRNITLCNTTGTGHKKYSKLGYKYIELGISSSILPDTYHSEMSPPPSPIPLCNYPNPSSSHDGYNNGGSLEIGISPDLITNENSNILAFKNFNRNLSFKIIFFFGNDVNKYDNNINSCLNSIPCASNLKYNQNLGWLLGYRPTNSYVNNKDGAYIKNLGEISITIPKSGQDPPININNYDNLTNTGYKQNYFSILGIPLKTEYTPEEFSYVKANGPVNTEGSQYFLLVLDDFNQSRINGGAVSIAPKANKLSLPEYANKTNNPDFECVKNTNSGKFSVPGKIPYLKSSVPRQLTQAQLYTVNEIKLNRKEGDDRVISPNNSNVLGFIPNPKNRNQLLIGEASAAPKINKRIYFGPVNIERLKEILIDDKGNTVNLHSTDWSFSLLATQLYQY